VRLRELTLAKLAGRGSPATRLPLTHTDRRVLAEPYKDNKKLGQGQRIQSRGTIFVADSWLRRENTAAAES
jgi:hypothetical protein